MDQNQFKVYKDPYPTNDKILQGMKGESSLDWCKLSPVTIGITKATTCPDCGKPSSKHPHGTAERYWSYSVLCNGELFHNPTFDPNPNIPL